MLYIDVPDMNDSFSQITLEGKQYKIRFTYNEIGDYWSFGLYDIKEKPFVAMTRIVKDFAPFYYYKDTDLPAGCFGCLSDTEEIGRYAFRDKTAEFIYLTAEEMEETNA